MTILVSETFETVTEDGDAADSGFIYEDEPMTFRELVAWMRGGEPSSYPSCGLPHDWVTQDQGETRAFFERGERESHSIHYSRKNPARKAKYWAKAMRAAGVCRGTTP